MNQQTEPTKANDLPENTDNATADSTAHWDTYVRKVESAHLDKPVDADIFRGWLDWDFVEEEYIRPQISGSRSVDYFGHFLNTHIKSRPVKRALSMGCGGGNLERAMIAWNAVEHIDAFDFSPESIRLAVELAEMYHIGDRLHYEVQDANHLRLPSESYDFAIAKMSLHHFENLEGVFEQVRQALKPDGLFVFSEFIGPTRYQWTDLQLKLINAILVVLPKRNQWNAYGKTTLDRIDRPTIEQMLAIDPSESVRSAEIMPVLKNYFDVVEYKPYGGALTHMLLTHVMSSFDLKDADQVAILRLIFLFEQTLMEHDVLPSDFAYVVARPKKTS